MLTDTTMKVLVAGGAPDVVLNGNFHRHLVEQGLEVGWHVGDYGGADTFRGIPKGCQAVIIMKDMTSHPMAIKVTKEAKAHGLAVAVVSSKWCFAEPILRIQGILPPANGAAMLYGAADIVTVARQYIERAREEDGRMPGYEELVLVIKKGLGADTVITPVQFSAAVSKAAQAVSPPILPVSTTPVTPTMGKPLTEEEIQHHVVDRMVEDPEVTPQVLVTELQFISSQSDIPEVVNQATKAVKTRWLSKTVEDQKWAQQTKQQWLINWFQKAYAEKQLPTYDEVNDRAKQVFGYALAWAWAQQARCKVVGDWADVLISAKQGQVFLDETGYTQQSLRTLIRDGKVKSLICGGKKFTSAKAVRDFLAAEGWINPPLVPDPVPTPDSAPVQQEPAGKKPRTLESLLDSVLDNIGKTNVAEPESERLWAAPEKEADFVPLVPPEVLLAGVDINPIADPVKLPVPTTLVPDPVVPTPIQVTVTLPMALTESMIEIKQALRTLSVQMNESNLLLLEIRDQLKKANPGITVEEVLAKLQKATVQIIVPGLTDVKP